MKQVWILNHYAIEPGGAGGTRHFSLAINLPSNNWQAIIIAASVELNSGRQRLAKGEQHRLEDHHGVPFLWIHTPEYKGNGLRRMGNMLTYTYRVLRPSYTRALPKPDIIIGSSVHPFAALAGAILAHRHKVPFIFEVRDLWPQTLIDLERLSKYSPITWLLRYLEKWLYHRATNIITLLPHAVDYIVPLGIPPQKIVWIPNGVNLSTFPSYPQKKQTDDPFCLMYFGAHGQANGLENVLRAMQLVEKKVSPGKIQLRLIGDGPLKNGLKQLAQDLDLNSVTFEPPVPKNEIPRLAAEADTFIFNLIDAPVFRFGISSNKLFEFMAAARPVIFCNNASNNPVKEANAGICVPPESPTLLADAIEEVLYSSYNDRKQWGISGRNYVQKNHSFVNLAKKLSQTLDDSIIIHG